MKCGVCQQGKLPCCKKDTKQELADLKQREEKGLAGKKMEGRGPRLVAQEVQRLKQHGQVLRSYHQRDLA